MKKFDPVAIAFNIEKEKARMDDLRIAREEEEKQKQLNNSNCHFIPKVCNFCGGRLVRYNDEFKCECCGVEYILKGDKTL